MLADFKLRELLSLFFVTVSFDKIVLGFNPNSLTPFPFLDYLLGEGRIQNEVPLGFKPRDSRTIMHCPPMARHLGVATRAAISFPYETHFYDVSGLSTFSSLYLVGF